MTELVRRIPLTGTPPARLLAQEWLLTNGLGGYASGTVGGVLTRRYHGLLIAALPAPLGRTVMLSGVREQVRLDNGHVVPLAALFAEERGELSHGPSALKEFRLEAGLPVWRYEVDGLCLEKRAVLSHLQNTTHVTWRVIKSDGPVLIELAPALHFRAHEAPVDGALDTPYALTVLEARYEFSFEGYPSLKLALQGPEGHGVHFTIRRQLMPETRYLIERSRGYEWMGSLLVPGHFAVELHPGQEASLVASTEDWDVIFAMTSAEALDAERERRRRLRERAPASARTGAAAELVLRTVIAGYHWFTDWGRDTMISLEGLTLSTGRHEEAGFILRTFAQYVRDGLIPNLFPEGNRQGLYHTADATLWFFHAVDRYLDVTGDRHTLRLLLPVLEDIVAHHLRGTHFGIRMDARDGLLTQGEEGYQLTWMDAKVGDWVVTPRRGKAVEINALWYNALRLVEGWVRDERGDEDARRYGDLAERTRRSFNDRFPCREEGYLHDVIDGERGDDAACRPNQLLAISLRHPVLDPDLWEPVLGVVERRLLTPVGLRSLSQGHRDYKPTYDGDLRARDAAYHQGTVWSWLIGPFIDAWVRVYPDDRHGARRFLKGLVEHLDEAGIGTVSEVFDAEAPFTPRGCIAQAWGVAEALRCWVKTG
jgi:predicted glycogen debranching enzyme